MKTYAMSNITSVNMHVNEPKLFLPVFFTVNMGICSFVIGISNMEAYAQCIQTVLYAVIPGTLLFLISRKTKYGVYIKSSAGELRVMEGNDREYAERIVKAMQEAVRLQGQSTRDDFEIDRWGVSLKKA